ncbi:MAG: hypothetical protein IT383_13980 [Deltaproteobacteria bacterium]|nr:hypothetical protein [Deltaproteobacteria bacterium]
MTPRVPTGDDDAVAAAFAEAAAARRPSRFETARAGRDLEGALDRMEARRVRALRPVAAATAVVVAGALGVVSGLAMSGEEPNHVAVVDHVGQTSPALTAFDAVATAPPAAVPPAAPGVPPPVLVLEVPVPPSPLQRPPRPTHGWRDAVASLQQAGDHAGAARALAVALRSDDDAAAPLLVAMRHAPGALHDVDEVLAPVQRAEPMRVRCELGLLKRRDRATLEACRAFAQQWPEHPGARVLAFAAGRLAEDELGDLAAAEAEFGRAILLAPLAGLPSTDALLARARVRASLGVLDEARSDLRLYLHQEPAAASEPSVRALMVRLDLANQD